ncbi:MULTISPECIES: phospholipid-binding protein MlaC [unclassified Oceanobacter]|jgi:phospholipid transport system substrate-binding protein|uniref:MlaC/ttg2D family ABC transporter substrate-binding protein n=1 Tax=unclassified Oceanobacter TaxID=2620260 RepID=UPI0026E24EB0|nr:MULTISPECIES: ABC transporter substrate-binding protein [unclassified Oceanobacter]MDO6681977.1 ABC transporter substrate-binding protein [Oceanobacter sp. 5_MG-2023]MDP2505339.1 ABC transporter substrate-binding protein [Oceanobacter sp. 3_MG-2023]MDP2548013.1 ABC transporter substrate-binding protein [Oceanobacter sp. 4_MG-2023]MDP2610133.1 ABC transporter substrate-binding protein [Oceanobacter sp. 1_MG-2023]MDP2612292.1 ABC transporter substrate-binding protein [Oceanobacter sp. 2_MG-20
MAMVLLSPVSGVQALESEALGEHAHEVVRRVTTRVMENINTNRDLYESDNARFYWELEDVLGPMVDFRRLTRKIMGRHYFDASKAQRQRFARAFKRSLLSSYATGLIEFTDYEVRMLPPRKDFEHTSSNTLVDLEVITPSGRIFPITQSMYYDLSAYSWKAQNVIVNGINIGQLFNEQFTQLVDDKNGNIGAAIEQWIDDLQEQGRELRKRAVINGTQS